MIHVYAIPWNNYCCKLQELKNDYEVEQRIQKFSYLKYSVTNKKGLCNFPLPI
jgi:hypothetical protein